MIEQGLKMNLLGDSITWGYTAFTCEQMKQSYPNIIKERMNLKELRNYGVNSSTLASGMNGYEPMCERYKQMDIDADIVGVFGGTNDFGNEEVQTQLGNSNTADISTIYGAIKEICVGLKNMYPNAFIFFVTPLQRAYLDKGCNLQYATNEMNDKGFTLKDVSNAIKQTCYNYEIAVFDLYQECDINTNEDCFKYLPDGIHPSEEYHRILAMKMEEFIKSQITLTKSI